MILYMLQPFLILSTRSCKVYAKKVVEATERNPERMLFPDCIDYTDELSVTRFADGEMEVTLHKSVRGKTVFLFTTAAKNGDEIPVEECKIELYHTIDVLQRSQAKKIIIFEPYMSCSRSDRTTRRNSVGLWIHYKTLISLGADHLVTYQLHSDKSKTVIDPCLCSIDDVPAVSILQRYLCDNTIKTLHELESTVRDNWLFCSVDAGGEKLAKRFSSAFGTQLIIAHKQRSYLQPNTIECINLLSAVPLKNKSIWIVDDMIDTGGSVYELVQELARKAEREINIMIVHPVFSGPAVDRLSELKTSGFLGRLVVCDTVCSVQAQEKLPFIEIIGSSELSAQIILTITQDSQMADIIDAFSPSAYLAGKK
jgi:ribose-phosphate pyrophosphokinase